MVEQRRLQCGCILSKAEPGRGIKHQSTLHVLAQRRQGCSTSRVTWPATEERNSALAESGSQGEWRRGAAVGVPANHNGTCHPRVDCILRAHAGEESKITLCTYCKGFEAVVIGS
mgnify:CR=1 FL=1